MHKGLTPLVPMMCDNNKEGTRPLSGYLDKRERGELQGDLKRLKEVLEGVLKALWKQQYLGLKTKSGLRPNSKEYRGFIYKTSPCAKDRS